MGAFAAKQNHGANPRATAARTREIKERRRRVGEFFPNNANKKERQTKARTARKYGLRWKAKERVKPPCSNVWRPPK